MKIVVLENSEVSEIFACGSIEYREVYRLFLNALNLFVHQPRTVKTVEESLFAVVDDKVHRVCTGGVVCAVGTDGVLADDLGLACRERIKFCTRKICDRFFVVVIAVPVRIDYVFNTVNAFSKGIKRVRNVRTGIDKKAVVYKKGRVAAVALHASVLIVEPVCCAGSQERYFHSFVLALSLIKLYN